MQLFVITGGMIAAAVGAMLVGAGGNLIADGVKGAMAPAVVPDPTLQEIIAPYLPQIIFIIIAIPCFLMYYGIFKYYQKKVMTILYPIILTIVYFVMSLLISILFSSIGLPIVAFFLFVVLTVFYYYIAIKIFKGKKLSKKIWIKK